MKTQDLTVENLLKIIEEKDKNIKASEARISYLEDHLAWITSQLKLSKNKEYGSSSEKTDSKQISLFNEAEELTKDSVPEPELTEIRSHYRKRTRLTTDKLPEDIPVEERHYRLEGQECSCPQCGNELHEMGKDCRDELKIIPAKAVILRHVQHVYSCRSCEANSESVPVVKAQVPNSVIKGSFASADTIAHIATQKYMMASPLYRQEQEWKQNGIQISRQSMANWLLKACELHLSPIYERLKEKLCQHEVLHADETQIQVLKEPGKAAKSKSYMWLYRTSGEAKKQIVIYEYQPDRRYIRPQNFLKDFEGYLHTDGFAGYHILKEEIKVVGCLAHLRRKFFDALKVLPKEKKSESAAAKAVEYCDRLFKLEKEYSGLSYSERYDKRLEDSKPILEEFYIWIDGLSVLPKSLLGKAVGYAKSQKKYIERFLLDGRLEISNNRAERSIKPFVLGRKNWMFSNTVDGAKGSSVYYSLIETAKENNLNPFEYLSWILKNMPNLASPGYAASIDDLLPDSQSIPEYVFVPAPAKKPDEILPWEED